MKRLPDSELEIMLIVWQSGGPVTRTEIEGKLGPGRKLSPTALLSFLSRLEKRGFVRVEKAGKSNVYTPLIGREEYLRSESRTFLSKLYGNSVKNFVEALVDGESVSDEDLDELYAYLREKGGGPGPGVDDTAEKYSG